MNWTTWNHKQFLSRIMLKIWDGITKGIRLRSPGKNILMSDRYRFIPMNLYINICFQRRCRRGGQRGWCTSKLSYWKQNPTWWWPRRKCCKSKIGRSGYRFHQGMLYLSYWWSSCQVQECYYAPAQWAGGIYISFLSICPCLRLSDSICPRRF